MEDDFNLKMYVKQLGVIIEMVEKDIINKDGLLIYLEGVKAQMEMDLE